MRFRVANFRNGVQILQSCAAFNEVSDVLARITLAEIEARRRMVQAEMDREAGEKGSMARRHGIQKGLNATIRKHLANPPLNWKPEVPVFTADKETRKGFWTMDFRKKFDAEGLAVGLEVTFNHAEALTWTPIRLTLAHESENALPGAKIDVGVVVIGTDQLKANKRMDSAVGTYERLRTVLPKMKAVLPAPIAIFALDWAEGGREGPVENLLG